MEKKLPLPLTATERLQEQMSRLDRVINHENALQRAINSVNSISNVARILEGSPTHQAMLQAAELSRSISQRMQIYTPELDALSKRVAEMSQAFRPIIGIAAEFQNSLSPVAAAMIAHHEQINSLSQALARAVEPFAGTAASIASWQSTLALRIDRIDVGWALPDLPAHSAVGFAHLTRLSEATHSSEPFAREVKELLDSELGEPVDSSVDDTPGVRDTAAIEAGFNPDLIAFPPQRYARIVVAAGFEFSFVSATVPEAIESVDTGAKFDPQHSAIIFTLEQHLRRFIEDQLATAFGPNWLKQQIPGDLRKRWRERQEQDRANGHPVYALIQYADFMDMLDIVIQRTNWDTCFGTFFRNKDDFAVSMRRLHPIRKAIAHARPLGQSSILTLASEATRVLGALGLSTLR